MVILHGLTTGIYVAWLFPVNKSVVYYIIIIFFLAPNCKLQVTCQYCCMDMRAGRWRRTQKEANPVFENKCYRRMLGIPYREHKRNECVWQQVDSLAGRRGRQELLLSSVKRRRLSWFGHVCRHDTLSKIIEQWTKGSSRRRARSKPRCHDQMWNNADDPQTCTRKDTLVFC